MYSLYKTPSTRNVSCSATRRQRAKEIFDSRKEEDKSLRSSLSSISKTEKQRVKSIWQSHKALFATIRNKQEDDSETHQDLSISPDDINQNDSFFEN